MSIIEEMDGPSFRHSALAGGEECKSAFEQFWLAFYRRMMHFSRTFPGIPECEREDAVADMLIAAFGAIAGFEPGRSFCAWVYGVARNKFLDAQRHNARIKRKTVSLEQSGSPSNPENPVMEIPDTDDFHGRLEARESLEKCAEAIDRLPGIDRQIAILRFYEEMDATEIGRVLSMAASSVRWRVASIRKEIAAYVEVGR